MYIINIAKAITSALKENAKIYRHISTQYLLPMLVNREIGRYLVSQMVLLKLVVVAKMTTTTSIKCNTVNKGRYVRVNIAGHVTP